MSEFRVFRESPFKPCEGQKKGPTRPKKLHVYLNSVQQMLARPLCRNVSGIFVVPILEDFAGDFPGGFFWAPFPTKMRRKIPASEIREKIRRPQKKKREKSVLPKTDPNRWCLENSQGRVSRQGLKTRFTPSESSAGHGLPPQRAPEQCPANGVRRIL